MGIANEGHVHFLKKKNNLDISYLFMLTYNQER